MSKRSECIANKSYTLDGIPIEGHAYETVVAVEDMDTGRSYYVLRCENCGKPSVSFTETDSDLGRSMRVAYVVEQVGGTS